MRIGRLIPFPVVFIFLAACSPTFTPVVIPTIETVNPNMATISLMEKILTFNFGVTGRFSIYLDDNLYPLAEFICCPPGIIGMVNNGTALGPGLFPVTYEGARHGSCTCVDRDFRVGMVIP
jgi:hypothetical protein